MGGKVCFYGAFRLTLWLAAAALALFPTVWPLDTWGLSIVSEINEHKHFRDLFFLLVPTGALSLGTTLDFIWADHTSATARNAAILALIANIGILLSGFVGFLMIKDDVVLTPSQFGTYWKVIAGALVVSLATELWVSGASERKRQLQNRNWNEVSRVRERARVLEAANKLKRKG